MSKLESEFLTQDRLASDLNSVLDVVYGTYNGRPSKWAKFHAELDACPERKERAEIAAENVLRWPNGEGSR